MKKIINHIKNKIKIRRWEKSEKARRLKLLQKRENEVLKMAIDARKLFIEHRVPHRLPAYLKNDIILTKLLDEVAPENIGHSEKLSAVIDELFELSIPYLLFRLQNTAELPAGDLN